MLSDPIYVQHHDAAECIVLGKPECAEQVGRGENVVDHSDNVHGRVQTTCNVRAGVCSPWRPKAEMAPDAREVCKV